MEFLKKLVNDFLVKNGKAHLITLSFEKKDVSFWQFNLAHYGVLLTYLNNNLIDCYESGDVVSAARYRSNILEITKEKIALEERIRKEQNPS